MTNEELLTDLKQFIEATISQQMADFATKEDLAQLATKDDINNLRTELKGDIRALDEKLDTIQDAIGETVTQVAESAEAAVREHEEHYHGRLKHRAA